jgi:hypothetical protein
MSCFFDDEPTLAMGAAFDRACSSLERVARGNNARELIAKRILEAAIIGEHDPVRRRSSCDDGLHMPLVSARKTPVAIFGAAARTHDLAEPRRGPQLSKPANTED